MITIRHVVCDREPYFVPDPEEKLCGIFSERDLLKRVVVKGHDPASVPIRDVMSEPRAVIDCADTPREALERMERVGSRHLPVVDGDKFVGMLSMRDIMRVEISEQGAELQLLHEYISH